MFCFVWRGGDVCFKDFHFSVIGLRWTLWKFRIAKELGKYICIIVRSLPTCAMMLQLALDQDAQGSSTQGQKQKGATTVLGRTPFSEKQYIYLHLINL